MTQGDTTDEAAERRLLAERMFDEQEAREVQQLMRMGYPLLDGPVTVQLAVTVEEAQTPMEAVKWTIDRIARAGFDSFVFAVHDPAEGKDYFVKAGELLMPPVPFVDDFDDGFEDDDDEDEDDEDKDA